MKRTMMAAALFLLAAGAQATTLTETVDKTFDVTPGARVLLNNVNGAIRVTSWDQPKVRVVAHKEVSGAADAARDLMRELRVDMQPSAGGLTITTRHPRENEGIGSFFDWLMGDHLNANVEYDVTVPRTMNVSVSNTNGSIHLTEISGALMAETTNGRIEATRCRGTLTASTTNGAIRAELLAVTQGQPVKLETTNGRIELAVPSTLAANVDADTTNGSIQSDLPVTTKGFDRDTLRGSINGGGPTLRLRTTNGGISIRSLGKS